MHLRLLSVLLFAPAAISAAKPFSYIDRRTTSTTSLECFHYDPVTTYLCIGASKCEPGNQFAVAGGTLFAEGGPNIMLGLTPEKTSINGQEPATNPLYGAQINLLRFVPFASRPTPVVVSEQTPNVIQFLMQPSQLVSSSPVLDAHGTEAERILSLATGPANSGNAYLLTAVQPKNGTFGSPGSGINAIRLTQQETRPAFTVDHPTTQLDLTSDAIKLNHDLSYLLNAVDIHWDLQLNRFYVALQAEAGPQDDAGVRSIVVGRFTKDGIKLDPIIPASTIDTNKNQIIGAIGSSCIAAVEKVRTLHTSTRLSYLIVAGGVGHPDDTNGHVYALPIVDYHVLNKASYDTNPTQGTIAATTALPKDRFSSNYPHALLNRGLTEPATLPEQLLSAHDAAAAVGRGAIPLVPGERIKDLITYRDTIHAVTQSCVYASQALFDTHGRIKNWTQWHIVMSSDDEIINATLDANDGFNGTARAPRFIFLTKSDDGHYTVQVGTWEVSPQHPVLKQLNACFTPQDGGITQLTACNDGLLALNTQKLAIAHDEIVDVLPSEYTAAIAPITAAIGTKDVIFVGGAHGLVAIESIKRSARSIGSYHHVRALLHDEHYIYVLTNHTFDRISLADFTDLTTLATPATLGATHGSFADAKVSDAVIVLATSFGLFRYSLHDLNWAPVDLPNGAHYRNEGPIRQLLPISPTSNPNDFCHNGMLYVLAQGAGESSRLYRLSVDGDCIQPLNDCFIRGEPSFLIEFGGRRSFIATDGAVIFDVEQQGGTMQLFQYGSPIVADTYGQRKNNRIFGSYGSIHMPVRLSTGEFIIPTSAGLIVYE